MGTPTLVWTDSTCILDGKVYPGIPVLLDAHYVVVEAATDWLRKIALSSKAPLTIQQYAYTLLNYWTFLSRRKKHWYVAHDGLLRRWRNNSSNTNRKLENRTVNGKLAVVLHFYLWAQENGYIKGLIGEVSSETGVKPPITIRWKERKSRKGKTLSSDLFLPDKGKTFKGVPTSSEMNDAFAELSRQKDTALATRNLLMMRWASSAGLRCSEILFLNISGLPSITKVLELISNEKACNITITGKGNKRRTVAVDPELVVNTLDYIDNERQAVLEKLCVPSKPDKVFISHTSGAPLNRSYVSQLLSSAFKSADRHLTLHRVRARYATKLFGVLLDEEVEKNGNLYGLSVETVLFRVAEQMGHSDINSLKYYLYLELKARNQVHLFKQLRYISE